MKENGKLTVTEFDPRIRIITECPICHTKISAFQDGKWLFWQEGEDASDHQETPLERSIRHELEWRYPTEEMARFQWALWQLAQHGLEYAQHPDKYPFPQPKGITPMTAKPPAKPPPGPAKPSTQPKAKGGIRLPDIGQIHGERPRSQG